MRFAAAGPSFNPLLKKSARIEPYVVFAAGYRCEVSPTLVAAIAGSDDVIPPDKLGPSLEDRLRREISRLLDPASSLGVLRRSRNRIDVVRWGESPREIDATVKEFRVDRWTGVWKQRIRGCTRAERAWRAALELASRGIPTPEPLLVASPPELSGSRTSFYVCRHLAGALEARRLVVALNRGQFEQEFPGVDVERALVGIGKLVRALHEAQLWHRDVTSGNLLLWPWPASSAGLYLIDLDRTRIGRRISPVVRASELCRLPLRRRRHQQLYLQGYFGAAGASWIDAGLYRICHRVYHLRDRLRVRIRRALHHWRQRREAAQRGERTTLTAPMTRRDTSSQP